MDSDHRVTVYQTVALTNFAILQLKNLGVGRGTRTHNRGIMIP